MENKQLTVVKTFDEIKQIGDAFAQSRFYDGITAAQAITKIIIGQDFGLSPAASMMGLHIINGKPEIGAHVMSAKVKASGKYDLKIIKCDKGGSEIEFFESGESVGVAEFTIDDAKTAGLIDKKGSNYSRYPEEMCFARAMSKGVRRFCSELFIMPVYAPNEMPASIESAPAEINVTPQQTEVPHEVVEEPKPEPAKPLDSPPVGQIKTAFDIDDLEKFEQWIVKYPDNTDIVDKFEYLVECISDPTQEQIEAEQKIRVSESVGVDGMPDYWKEWYGVWQKIGHANTHKIRKKYLLRFRCDSIDWINGTKAQVNWIEGQFKHYGLNPNQENDIKEIFETTEEPEVTQ